MTTQLSHFDYGMKKNANSKIFSCKNALNLSQKKLLQESAVFLKTTYKNNNVIYTVKRQANTAVKGKK